MEKNNSIGEKLFRKLRGRFSQIEIGDADANVVSDPSEARFFEFEYTSNGLDIGKVSVNVNDDDLTVIYSKDLIADKSDVFKDDWYEFLKEMRKFAKRNLLQFDVRDIEKSNLTKRDYKGLAKEKARSGEDKMNESKMYGTAHTSYQRVDGARIVIKHNSPINTESAAGRTQHISAIYIESAEGERFKYPYKHLSGARAMARHVAEGGKLYDDFGSHIVGLSEEMHKLRKFKSYMGKSNVMAESLSEYMDVVNTRIAEVKKTVDRLQKTAYYKEAVDSFEKPILEDVPADVADSWIDQLTIKQFNEELKDVFPYIYRLVGEAKRVETIALENILDEFDSIHEANRTPEEMARAEKLMPQHQRLADMHFDAIKAARAAKNLDLAEKHRQAMLTHRKAENKLGWGIQDAYEWSAEAMQMSKELGIAESIEEVEQRLDPKYWSGYTIGNPRTKLKGSVRVNNCVPEEIELEQAFEAIMGQFADNEVSKKKVIEAPFKIGDIVPGKAKVQKDDDEDEEVPSPRLGKPYIKFRYATINPLEGTKSLVAYVGYAYSPKGLTPSTFGVKRYNVNTAEELYNMLDYIETQPTFAKSEGARIVFDAYTKELVNLEKFPDRKYLFDFIQRAQSGSLKGLEVADEITSDKVYKVRLNPPDPTKTLKKKKDNDEDDDNKALNKEVNVKVSHMVAADGEGPIEKGTMVNIVSGPHAGMPALVIDTYETTSDKKGEMLVAKVKLDNDSSIVIEVGAGSLLVLSKDEYGNPEELHQGTKVAIEARGSVSSRPSIQKSRHIKQDDKADQERAQLDLGLSQFHGQTGTVVSVRELEKAEKVKPYKDQKFKDLVYKQEGTFNHFFISNRKTFFALRGGVKKDLDKPNPNPNYIGKERTPTDLDTKTQDFMKYYKPDFRGFIMQDDVLDRLKQVIFSNDWLEAFGDPGLIFVSDRTLKDLDNKELDKLPPKVKQFLTKQTPNKPNNVDLDSRYSNRELDKQQKRLAVYRRYIPDTMSDVPDINKTNFMEYVRKLENEINLDNVVKMSVNMIIGQTSVSMSRADREELLTRTLQLSDKKDIEKIKEYLYDRLITKHIENTKKMLPTDPSRIVVKSPTNLPPEKDDDLENYYSPRELTLIRAIPDEDMRELGQQFRDQTMTVRDYKNYVTNLLGTKSLMTPETLKKYKALIIRAKNKYQVAKLIYNLDAAVRGYPSPDFQMNLTQDPKKRPEKKNLIKPTGSMESVDTSKQKSKKIPFTEFIMSHCDRNTGQLPKGETAVLTMIEKEYGDKYIEPAKAFIERLTMLYDEYQMRNHPQQMETGKGLDRIKTLAGL